LFLLRWGEIDLTAQISYNVHVLMKKEKTGPEDFEALIKRFAASIRATVLKFGLERKGIDPEDVLQEVRIRIWKAFLHEKKVSDQASYIKRVVNTTLVDQMRKARRQEKLIDHEKQKWRAQEKTRPGEEGEEEAAREMIGRAADSLLESRRKVVKMFLLNLSVEEISLILNWSRHRTRNLLYRGLSDLKGKLREKGIEYEDR
jgi:RNA polymerase sigma factor (sigma-70 family)